MYTVNTYNEKLEGAEDDKQEPDKDLMMFLSKFFHFYRDKAFHLGFLLAIKGITLFLCHVSVIVIAYTEPKPFNADI